MNSPAHRNRVAALLSVPVDYFPHSYEIHITSIRCLSCDTSQHVSELFLVSAPVPNRSNSVRKQPVKHFTYHLPLRPHITGQRTVVVCAECYPHTTPETLPLPPDHERWLAACARKRDDETIESTPRAVQAKREVTLEELA